MLKFLGENLLLKVIAMSTSVMIWLYVSYINTERANTMTVRRLNAEIKTTGNTPDDLLVSIRGDLVPVEVNGPQNEVDTLEENAIKAVVDVGTVRQDTTQLRILRYERPPNAARITFRELRLYVPVNVTAKVRKQIRITAIGSFDAPAGTRYGAPRVAPGIAAVIGRPEDVQRVAKLVVYVENRSGAVRADLPIVARDQDDVEIESVQIEPRKAHVELDLEEAPATRTLVVSVSHHGTPAPPYEITSIRAEPDQITVVGRLDELAQMTNVPTADLSVEGIMADFTGQVRLLLPPGVRAKDGRNAVTVSIRLRDTSKQKP